MVIECRFVFADRGPFPYSVSAEEDALKMYCDSLPIRASGSELYSFCSFKSCFSIALKNGKRTFLRVHYYII